ncbi:cell division protein SepF, partial [Curtobacterium sp. CT11-133]
MANPLKKTMVYLGLADEELEYEDEQPQQPARQQSAPAPAPAPAPVVTAANPTHAELEIVAETTEDGEEIEAV